MTNNVLRGSLTRIRRLSGSYAIALALGIACGVSAQSAYGQGIPNQVLADLIKQQKLVANGQNVKAVLDQSQAIITCDRDPGDSDEACKRRAILIAKCVFDSQPDQIQKSKIQFLNVSNMSLVTVGVKRSEIAMFGQGKLDEKELMGSIDFQTEGVGSKGGQAEVADGDMQLQRSMLLRRIEKMKQRGTNVSAFMNIFNQIEELAKSGDSKKLASQIDFLSEKVSEQEQMVKQASATRRPTGGSIASTGGSGGFKMPLEDGFPPELATALMETKPPIDSKTVEALKGLRNLLLNYPNNPFFINALGTLDGAIKSRNLDRIHGALHSVEGTLTQGLQTLAK